MDNEKRHEIDKSILRKLLSENEVDLIVVSADCLDARKLKNTFYTLTQQKANQEEDGEDKQDNYI